MALFGAPYTNIFWDGEIAGLIPDALSDYYNIEDAQYDHIYKENKLCDMLISLSTDNSKEFYIISGGIISDAGSGRIDISECVCASVDSSGNKHLVYIPTLSGVNLPSGWKDNRQIWVIAKYNYKLGTLTRPHYVGNSYHYQLEDTYLGDPLGYNSSGTDDLFVDADPNTPTETVVCLGSFTMSSINVFADLSSGERTSLLKLRNTLAWKGVLTSAPANPVVNWAYYNVVNRKSYIYDGDIWQDMTSSGAMESFFNPINNNFSAGTGSLNSNTTGGDNIAIGQNSLNKNTIGAESIAIGSFALEDNTTGLYNVAIGYNASKKNTTATSNVAIGHSALLNNTIGISNIAIGQNALRGDTTGKENVAIGYGALYSNTIGFRNIAIGDIALTNNTTGTENVAIGRAALTDNVTGQYNVAVGNNVLNKNTASFNVAIGASALTNNTTGPENVAVGYATLTNNTTGVSNIAVGYFALKNNTCGDYNVAVGREALYSNTTGIFNTAIGLYALHNNVTGNFNTAIGSRALWENVSGGANTAVGHYALTSLVEYSNCSGLGAYAQVTGSNQVQLGYLTTTVYAYGAVQDRSDKRDKIDIKDAILGLNFIKELKPRQFKYNYREFYRGEEKDLGKVQPGSNKKGKRYHQGLIAQEVKETMDKLGIDFGGYQDHKINGGQDVLSLGYNEFVAPLIKAIQELSIRLEKLESK